MHSSLKRCKVNIIVFFSMIGLTGCLAGFYYYVMIYRQQTEPQTTAVKTNSHAVLYEVEEQLLVLKRYKELYHALNRNALETDMGMVVIPGMESTRTMESNESRRISVCTSMTPQGLCVTEKYILVSAYCHTKKHNSVIYVIDKHSHQLIKEIILKDKDHVGGLAYDSKHRMIWVSTGYKGHAAASAFLLHHLEQYDFEKLLRPISYVHEYELYTLETDSFMTYDNGYLYIGHFSMDAPGVVQKFKIDGKGGLETRSGAALGIEKEIAIPQEIKRIPDRIQGFAVLGNKVLLTQSYGCSLSKLLVYQMDSLENACFSSYPVNIMNLPQKAQQIYPDGQNLYALFESAAYAYRAQPFPKVDRICKLRLADVVQLK